MDKELSGDPIACGVLHISYATLKKQLSLFEQAGLLLTQREGKAKFYSLDTEKPDAMRMQL